MSKSDQLARQETPFSKRVVRPNPLLKGRDEQRERRRDLFMKKVEQGRDDKRWEGRSDQVRFLRALELRGVFANAWRRFLDLII